MLPTKSIRDDFPIFHHIPDLIYLDSGATSQKPLSVIKAISDFYSHSYASVHRGVYTLSEQSTLMYEQVRAKTAKFLGPTTLAEEIVFTAGTTDALNLLAETCGATFFDQNSEILLSVSEHHSNLLPWQKAAQKTGAKLKFFSITPDGRVDLKQFQELLSPKTKAVIFPHVSNVLGFIAPAQELCTLAAQVGAISIIDGAQAIPHIPVNVKEIGCDFYCFSPHKMLGPTGVGVLYGKKERLEQLPPYRLGGSMLISASLTSATWAKAPTRFEAGTPPIASVIGLGAAIDYLSQIDRKSVLEHERYLGAKAIEFLKTRPAVRILIQPELKPTPSQDWVGLVSFVHQEIHPHDLASIFDQNKVCIRAGFHCAEPLAQALNVGPSCRISPYIYNSENDINKFIESFLQAESIFK